MKKGKEKNRLDLNDLTDERNTREFRIILETLKAYPRFKSASAQKKGGNREDPVKQARDRIKALDGGSDHAADTRISRKISYLLKLGVLDFTINETAIKELARNFHNSVWLPMEFESEESLLLGYLKTKTKVEFVFAKTATELHRALMGDLGKALYANKGTQAVISHGQTFRDFASLFEKESSNFDEWRHLTRKDGEPLLLPSSGNYTAAQARAWNQSEYEYIYDFSGNQNAKTANSALQRKSLRLDMPAIFEYRLPKENPEDYPSLDDVKFFFQSNPGYRKVYTAEGRVVDSVKTLLFTFGTPLDAEGRYSYAKFLKDYEPDLPSDIGKMDEILLRFYLDGKLQGSGKRSTQKGSRSLSGLDRLYRCYLGLKENACLALATEHRTRRKESQAPLGLGSVMVATDARKMKSLLVALLLKGECFINTVYLLSEFGAELLKQMKKMPPTLREDFEEYKRERVLQRSQAG